MYKELELNELFNSQFLFYKLLITTRNIKLKKSERDKYETKTSDKIFATRL